MEEQIKNCRIILGDNMEYMKNIPDKYYGLCVVDPPYGLGEDGLKNHSRSNIAKAKEYTPKSWDKSSPDIEYFNELIRISMNQIIQGANHFISKIPYDSSCWLVWNKLNGDNDFADCELAWTSFKRAVRKFDFRWAGMLQGNMKNKEIRIHPTQKPIKLYEWIYINYAEKGMKILDTHLGSGSSAIAAYRVGMDLEFTGIEIDEEYYNNAVKRIKWETSQGSLFQC